MRTSFVENKYCSRFLYKFLNDCKNRESLKNINIVEADFFIYNNKDKEAFVYFIFYLNLKNCFSNYIV